MVVGHRLASEVGEELTKPPRARGALKWGAAAPVIADLSAGEFSGVGWPGTD